MKGTGELLPYVDFDGTLHHENVLLYRTIGVYLDAPFGYTLFQHAELLKQLQLLPYPEVMIVLSTTWVHRFGCTGEARNLRPALRSGSSLRRITVA